MSMNSNIPALDAIWDASSDGVALFNGERRLIEVNPAFGRMFDVSPSQLVGRECADLFGCHTGEPPACCQHGCMLEQAVARGQPLPYAEVDISIQETTHLLGMSVSPAAIETVPVCLLVVRDLTTMRAATRSSAKFLSLITHELRSPLNAINGYLDLTLSGVGGDLTSQHREFVQRARAGSEHLYALLEDLLLISRADAGPIHLHREILALPTIIENAVEELELTAADNAIQIHVTIAPDLPRLYADALRLQQVLRNLINNALQFTSAGGDVTITATMDEIKSVLPPAIVSDPDTDEDEGPRMITLQVHDTGCGIAPEFQERIFERFFQVPNEHVRHAGGQGLGLAIVKMIVALHGGSVTLESVPGQGSTFTCLFPCLLR
jgi:signal transduction histidine kinase